MARWNQRLIGQLLVLEHFEHTPCHTNTFLSMDSHSILLLLPSQLKVFQPWDLKPSNKLKLFAHLANNPAQTHFMSDSACMKRSNVSAPHLY